LRNGEWRRRPLLGGLQVRIVAGMNTTTSNDTATLWTVDPRHTTVGFSVRRLMIKNVRGMFDDVWETVRYDADRRPPVGCSCACSPSFTRAEHPFTSSFPRRRTCRRG
jgi:hypothetical protein